jgi:hypothetical protein
MARGALQLRKRGNMLNRRIGANEREAIIVLRAYIDA